MGPELASRKRADRLVGELLADRYRIEAKIGEGAMGAVYRARHVKLSRPFAVKLLHERLLDDKKTALRFEREAELASRLHHPNVIAVVDVGETADGLRYMVMDFAEGADLAELLSEAPMPPARIIHLVRQLLEGLYHAHEAGLIHRDFKPENVIVERNDHGTEVPRIVDFGISILREGGASTDAEGRLTTNGLVLGTPHYMAPEQAVADPIDHRIDLFALGIVVYEMLCGILPFDGNGTEVARANLLLDPPRIAERVPHLEVDPLLEAFARLLMSKHPDHRPANAKQARDLLDLIERDRTAAAAALGVPLDVGTRPPQPTQPVDPQLMPAAPPTPPAPPAQPA
ncbi:MAG TPA: serine/threonine-protein kinase, partial [Kofleriaceae bacterium]|nr:serine/threonine-protein kinase [Kofleriaceae bacterium]